MITTQKARVFDTFWGVDLVFRGGPILNMLRRCQKPRFFRDFCKVQRETCGRQLDRKRVSRPFQIEDSAHFSPSGTRM